MNFDYSDKVKSLQKELTGFMDAHIYPNEGRFFAEIEANPEDLEEWIDVVILALDGYWRHGGEPIDLMWHLQAKQDKNYDRQWPAPGPEDEPTEHVRQP